MSAGEAVRRGLGRETLVIARREWLERVRSRWFLIGTLLGPIAMLAVVLVPALLAAREEKEVAIAVVDRSAGRAASAGASAGAPSPSPLVAELTAVFAAQRWRVELVEDLGEPALLARVRERKINGFLILPADVLDNGVITYQGDNGTSASAMARLELSVTKVVQHRRGLALGISDEQVLRLMAPVRLSAKHTTGEAGGSSGMATFIVGYAVMFILYLAILLYASNVMRSVVQEKTSRVVELMVAAVKPGALMAGKVLGVGAVGLIQLVVWLGMAVATLKYREALLGLLGVSGSGGVTVPPLSVAQAAVVVVYFLLGYFLYASMYAAVGAMVSSEQEAQQAQMPLMILIMIALGCVQLVANDPRGTSAAALTTIPFFSPFLMPMRYLLGGASATSLATSLLVLVATLGLAVVAAGRIYRVGILMYGKRPSAGELLRWLRH